MPDLPKQLELAARRFFWLLSLTVAGTPAAGRCRAQPPASSGQSSANAADELTKPQVSLTFQHAKMAEVIAALAKQSGRNILVVDEPQENTTDLEFKGSCKDALNKIASVYDYAWTLDKRHVVVLTKRFTRPDEHPQLITGELRQIVADSLMVLGAFDINLQQDESKLLLDMFATLKPEQVALMQSGKTLPVMQLSDGQRQQLERVIQINTLGRYYFHWSQMLPDLDHLLPATPASSLRLAREERDVPNFTSLTAQEKAHYPRQWEVVEFLAVDRRGNAHPVWLYNQSVSSRFPAPKAPADLKEKQP